MVSNVEMGLRMEKDPFHFKYAQCSLVSVFRRKMLFNKINIKKKKKKLNNFTILNALTRGNRKFKINRMLKTMTGIIRV
jgi:hypothetical protein